jgi:hypothetical protein
MEAARHPDLEISFDDKAPGAERQRSRIVLA